MRHVKCERCFESHPMNDMFQGFGRSLCKKCVDHEFAERSQEAISQDTVKRQTDPTICSSCGRDGGDAPLQTLGGSAPVCAVCEQKFRHYPYPTWIKAALSVLVGLVVLSSLHNWRFFAAYAEIQRGVRRAEAQDLTAAIALLDSASRRVPESKEVTGIASFYRGLDLLAQEKSAEALPHFQNAFQVMSGDRAIQDYVLYAEIGVAFDRKDYDRFLAKSKAMMERNPNDATAVAGVASAYACKWAETGVQGFKELALNHLEEARRLAGMESATFKEYENRILFRLDSREIINREEYQRRFPGGYVRKGEAR